MVTHINWEYNDEQYYTTDGNTTTNVYASLEKAVAECDRLNLEWMMSTDELEAYLDADWENEYPELFDAVKEIVSTPDKWQHYRIPKQKDLSSEQVRKLFALAKIHFYEVVEMELE
jgi:hypothetical protein